MKDVLKEGLRILAEMGEPDDGWGDDDASSRALAQPKMPDAIKSQEFIDRYASQFKQHVEEAIEDFEFHEWNVPRDWRFDPSALDHDYVESLAAGVKDAFVDRIVFAFETWDEFDGEE